MIRTVLLLGLLAGLAACGDGQPVFPDDGTGGGGGGGGGTNPPPATDVVPADIANSLTTVSFVPPSDGGDGSLLVNIAALDSSPVEVAYERSPQYDVPGYSAYTIQEDPLDRHFTGLAGRSADGSVQGAVVMDGGQFNQYFGGVRYSRLTPYSAYVPSQPDRGLVSYAGTYAGMLNVSTREGTLPVPDGTDPSLLPDRAGRVTGDVFLDADFTNNKVNGSIYNRATPDFNGLDLAPVILVASDIGTDGRFAGTAEDEAQKGIGTYAGAFGGTNASAVAGGVYLQGHIEAVDREEERGVFVLMRCGLPGDSAICDVVDP